MSINTLKAILALIPIMSVCAISFILIWFPPPALADDFLRTLLGAMIILSKESYSYYFGASHTEHKEGGA